MKPSRKIRLKSPFLFNWRLAIELTFAKLLMKKASNPLSAKKQLTDGGLLYKDYRLQKDYQNKQSLYSKSSE